MDTKYIIFNGPGSGEFPVLFPQHIKHSMMAQCVMSSYPGIIPVRAGFVSLSIGGDYFNCYGKSKSLELESDSGHDSNMITIMFDL